MRLKALSQTEGKGITVAVCSCPGDAPMPSIYSSDATRPTCSECRMYGKDEVQAVEVG